MSVTRWFRQPLLYVFCLALVSCDREPTALERGELAVPEVRDRRSDALERRQPDLSQLNAATLPTQCPEGATKWVNAVSGSWFDAARWSAGVPTATKPACIDLPGAYVVTLHASFANVTVPALSVFLGDPGSAVQPTLRVTQGTVIVSTDVTAYGRIELSPGTGASFTAAGTIGVASTGTLIGANTAGKLFEAAAIENDGTIDAGTGLGLRAATIVNRGSIVVPASRLLVIRGPTSGGAPAVAWEAGEVNALGTFDQVDGDLIVRGGTFTGLIRLHDADELRLEHDGGGRFNILSLGGFVPPTTTLLAGVVGANQHVWMGTNHLTVRTSGLVNKGLVTLNASGALGRQGLILTTDPGATIVNEGTLVLNAASPFNLSPAVHGAITNAESGLIVNEGGTVAFMAPNPLINRGTLRAAVSQIRIGQMPDGTEPDVIFEGGTVESTVGRYQQTRGTLAVLGGTVTGTFELIAMTELRLEHDAGGRFNLLRLPGMVPATTSRLTGTVGPGQHVWMGSNHLTIVTPGLVNQGQVTVESNTTFGTIGASLRTIDGGIITNATTGTITLSGPSGPTLAGSVINEGLIANTGHAGLLGNPLVNRGIVRAAASLQLNANAPVGEPSPIFINDGGRLDALGSYNQTRGRFEHLDGTVTGTGATTFNAVRFSGFGTWGRGLTLSGASSLAPGASPGRIAITGDYTPSTTTVTEIELAGSEPGTGYDQIAIANTARFAGTLSVSLADGFVPRACQAFEVVTYAARTGTFANATTPIDIGGGMKLRQVYMPTALVLVAYSANGPNVSPTQVEVSVDAVTDTYDVCIGAGADVITVLPDDQVTVDKQTLTFANSALPQTVTVAAAPGANRSEALIRHSASSGTPVANVTVLIAGIAPSDNTPPVIESHVVGSLGNNGWYVGDVTVSWSVSDAESDIVSRSGCGDSHITSDTDGTTLTCTATSAGGTSTQSVVIKRDATAPLVAVSRSHEPNAPGWYNTDVTVTYTATDATSGIDGAAAVSQTFTLETANQSGSHTFSDRAGNQAIASVTGINLDKTAPQIGYTGNLGSYTMDQEIGITCSASDPLSGLASTTCINITGLASTFGPGTHTFSATARDNAGNSSTVSTSFTVGAVTFASLCALTQQYVTNPGVAQSLCEKLNAAAQARTAQARAGQIGAYVNQVQAQTGKTISQEHAEILIRLAQALL